MPSVPTRVIRLRRPRDVRLSVSLTPVEQRFYERGRRAFVDAYRRYVRATGRADYRAFAREAARDPRGRRALRGLCLARQVVSKARNKRELADKLMARHAAARVLIVADTNAAAYALSDQLLIAAVTRELSFAERRELLDALDRDELRALVCTPAALQRIAVPPLDVAIVTGGAQARRARSLPPISCTRHYTIVARRTFEVRSSGKRSRDCSVT